VGRALHRRLRRTQRRDPPGLGSNERAAARRPAKLAAALVESSTRKEPPVRWVAGADAVVIIERKARDLLAQVDAYRDLSTSLALDAVAAGS
jgi:hypothetical protein